MNIHISSNEGNGVRRRSKLAKRVRLHYHQTSVEEYIDYVVDDRTSKRIAVVGEIKGRKSKKWPVLT